MDENRVIINATATTNGGTIFTDAGYYWSSTENSSNSAWVVWFSHDYQTNANKGQYWCLRAVRAF